MGVFQNHLMAAAVAKAAESTDFYSYQIANSIRFDGSSSVLTKTWGADATDNDKWAISVWVKGHKTDGTWEIIASCAQSELMALYVGARSDSDAHAIGYYTGNGGNNATSLALGRDVSAWRHIVMIYDSSQGAGADRIKIYNNGVHWTTASATYWGDIEGNGYPDQNTDSGWGLNGNANEIGRYQYNSSSYYSGYIADFISIDGAASISDFGETKNGVWIPSDPSGLTFGTNGFWLNFASSGDLGNDVSGNNNDWSVAGLSAHDQMIDSPTFDGTSNGGNFCTLNPLGKQGGGTKSGTCTEGNLLTAGGDYSQISTFGLNAAQGGKWYWEAYCPTSSPSGLGIGIANDQCNSSTAFGYNSPSSGVGADMIGYYSGDDNGALHSGVTDGTYADSSYGANFNSAEIIGIAVDVPNAKIWFSNGGSWQESGDPAAGSDPARGAGGSVTTAMDFTRTWYPMFANWSGSSRAFHFNFGQDSSFSDGKSSGSANAADDNGYGDFYYDVPAGFMALCAANLATPGADPAADTGPYKYYTNKGYTGDGASTLTISGLEFQPDFTWIKNRDQTDANCLFDATRGVTELLISESSGAEATDADTLKSWTSDGYTVGADVKVNTSSEKYISWNWLAGGGSGSSNTDGSINTTTTTVDADRGVSISTYTGTGSAATIGHGLGVAPRFIIVKDRGATNDWAVYHAGLATDPETDYILLNGTAGSADDSTYWNDTAPTTTLFSIGTNADVNTNTNTYIAYAFADIDGFSRFGSFTGNGNTDGTYVTCGFRPSMLVRRRFDANPSGSWLVKDDVRNPFNDGSIEVLNWNQNSAENAQAESSDGVDFHANGFKLKATNNGSNGAGLKYIYMAWAANPLKYSTAF